MLAERKRKMKRRDMVNAGAASLGGFAIASIMPGLTGSRGALAATGGVLASPDPMPARIEKGPLAVELAEFSTPPASSTQRPYARLNHLFHASDGAARVYICDTRASYGGSTRAAAAQRCSWISRRRLVQPVPRQALRWDCAASRSTRTSRGRASPATARSTQCIPGRRQFHIEEVNIIVRGGNYGWPMREGTFVTDRNDQTKLYHLAAGDDAYGYVYPVAQYDHTEGTGTEGHLIAKGKLAITGGFVYRGSEIPGLVGHYISGDLVNGRIFHVPASELQLDHGPGTHPQEEQPNGHAATARRHDRQGGHALRLEPKRHHLRFDQAGWQDSAVRRGIAADAAWRRRPRPAGSTPG
jgi:hypothetical protein